VPPPKRAAHGVELEHGLLDAETIIWAAGIGLAGGTLARCGTRSRRAGEGRHRLSVPSHPDIGDTAAVTDQPGIPGTAPPAKQMGRYVGRLIAGRVAGGPSPPPFRYRHMYDLATIGRQAAVVKLGRLELTGFLGWLFWSECTSISGPSRMAFVLWFSDFERPHSNDHGAPT
jgi:NADH dehydrogenase